MRGVNGLADGLRANFFGLSADSGDDSAEPVDDVDDGAVVGRSAKVGSGGVDCGGVGC